MLFLMTAWAITVNAEEAKEIKYPSTADNSEQPAMFYEPPSNEAVPLVVALHTWSGTTNRRRKCEN